MLIAAGFVPERGFFRRMVSDVVWFFDWQRPYERAGLVRIDPILCVGSPNWMEKVGVSLNVEPGSTQLTVRLVALAEGPTAQGYSIADDDWEESCRLVGEHFQSVGLELLSTIKSTDDLVLTIEEHPEFSPKLRDRDHWEAQVWRGELDPQVNPYSLPSTSETKWSRDELIETMRSSKQK